MDVNQEWADQETAAAAFLSGSLSSHVYAAAKEDSSEVLSSEEATETADAITTVIADATGSG